MFSLKKKGKAISLSIKHLFHFKTELLKCWEGQKALQITKKAWMNTFLTASEMVNIFEEICEAFDAHGEAPKKSQHYQQTGSKSEGIKMSANRVRCLFLMK